MLKLLFVMACFELLGACAGPTPSVTRQVSEEENSLYSSANPRVKLTISPELEFLGKIEQAEYKAGIGVPVGAVSYFWGDVQEKSVPKGFLLRVLTIPDSEDLQWDSQIFSGVTKKLEAGTVEIEEGSYEYVSTVLPEPLSDYEEQFVTSADYTLPYFFMVHVLGQLDPTKKVKSYLLYFNHIDPAGFNDFLKKFVSDEWDETDLNDSEQQLLQEFLEQFRQDIQFQPF
ncbi:MAG: hypothetical protein GY801_35275 [bacterium]|nr:hypothetical protein [bacterium]